MLCVFVLAVTMQGWTDAQEEFESVTEIVADCDLFRPVVISGRDGIDEGHN